MQRLGTRLATPKVKIAARVARQASKSVRITTDPRSVVDADVAVLLTDCDHIFLAADSALARPLVNSITHQYLIPNTQVGSKVTVIEGQIADIFSVSRMSSPGNGCLRCNGLIPAWRLTEEATSEIQRRRQRLVVHVTLPAALRRRRERSRTERDHSQRRRCITRGRRLARGHRL
ncbi:ThiF family adenylyltransferase [Rhodococcus sp. NPDC059968]|uniref:ThiF family adenylyltransferase n=1 Tax=Rhodococcus sp. NPDC059968 TaxID=3347017 RepID=UPI003672E1C5